MEIGISGLSVERHSSGYLLLIADGKKLSEHRYIMEQKLNRKLKSGEIVHHIDGNKSNNDPSNLCLTNNIAHTRYHNKLRKFKNCMHLFKEELKDDSAEDVKDTYRKEFSKNGKPLGRPKGS